MNAPIPPTAGRLRVLRATVNEPEGLARRVCDSEWLNAARIVKADNRAAVRIGVLGDARIVVRTTHLARVTDVVARRLGRTRGLRHWRGAELLAAAGVRTPAPRLLFRGRGDHGVVETLVSDFAPGESLLNCGNDARVARLVGGQVARLHGAGVFHRDHKASNILVDDDGLVLLDTEGVRRERSERTRLRMLATSVVELWGVGRLPRRANLLRALLAASGDESDWKGTWRAVEAMLAAHGDPTPRDDPRDWA